MPLLQAELRHLVSCASKAALALPALLLALALAALVVPVVRAPVVLALVVLALVVLALELLLVHLVVVSPWCAGPCEPLCDRSRASASSHWLASAR